MHASSKGGETGEQDRTGSHSLPGAVRWREMCCQLSPELRNGGAN